MAAVDKNIELPSAAQMCALIRFLRAVHEAPLDLYHDGLELNAAAERYVAWLATVASGRGGRGGGRCRVITVEAPLPVAEAWCWHCHRLAPLKYLDDCRRLGGAEVAPGVAAAFQVATGAATLSSSPAREESSHAPVGAAALVAWIVACARRQASFLWRVSGEAYADVVFLNEAVGRYRKFLSLAGVACVAPPLDVDLAWHTHILRGAVSVYATETAALCGGSPLNHDDSLPAPELAARFENTKVLWDAEDEADGEESEEENKEEIAERTEEEEATSSAAWALKRATRPGLVRGDAPPWFFQRDGPAPVVVEDNFLDDAEIQAILQQMPAPADAVKGGGGIAAGRGFGKDARCAVDVPAALQGRIAALVAERLGVPPPPTDANNGGQGGDVDGDGGGGGRVRLPARVAVGEMRAHRDRLAVVVDTDTDDGAARAIVGPYADGYVAVVYLRGDGALHLEPDAAADAWIPTHAWARMHAQDVEVRPGRLVAWPNFAFKHGGNSDCDSTGGGTVKGTAGARWLLGPVALLPGRASMVQAGDCGGGGGGPVRRPAPNPPTASRLRTEVLQGTFQSSCAPPACPRITLTAEGPDEFVAHGMCFFCCCFCGERYTRFVADGPFEANGGSAMNELVFASHDPDSLSWGWCWAGRLVRIGARPGNGNGAAVRVAPQATQAMHMHAEPGKK